MTSAMVGVRATVAILAGLPLLGVLLSQLVGARSLIFLLNGRAGSRLLVFGFALVCMWLLWPDRLA
ncbi:hypothetical protein [Mycobacterium uberis]|uniref:hypothetical protein n=1 Tax=Mycobacterium uberis TaxID=2162698 RepID=UPI000E2FF6DF|nr:hypothetical protein [Mycobacterium uberis]